MDTQASSFVAGVFSSQSQAQAAEQDLRRLGLDDQIEIGIPEQGHYLIERSESAELGRGVVKGVVLGIVIGGVIGVGFVIAAVPGAMEMAPNSLVLGFLIGAFWGIFFGGLGGMVPAVLAQEHASRWFDVTANNTELVVIAHTDSLPSSARTAMKKHGVRYLLEQAPVVHPVAPSGAVRQVA